MTPATLVSARAILFSARLIEAQGDKWGSALAQLKAEGLAGVALTEAKGDMLTLARLVRAAVEKKYEAEGRRDVWADLEALYADRVIAREDGKLVAYPYVVADDDTVTLGAAQPVEQTFAVVSPTIVTAPPAPLPVGTIIEAVAAQPGQAGTCFRVRIVRAGLSGNANYYSDAVLREAAPLFEGVRVFVKGDQEHLSRASTGKDVRNLVGKITDIAFVEGAGPDKGELQGTLAVLDSAGDIAARMTEATARGMSDVFGLSMDADGLVRPGTIGGHPAKIATRVTKVRSVDIIVEPGAGGGIINLIESHKEHALDRDTLIAMLEAKGLLAGKDPAAMTDAELAAILTEALDNQPKPGTSTIQVADAVMAQVNARMHLTEALANSRLPAAARERIGRDFASRASYAAADVDAAITAERQYLANFTESGRVIGLGGGARIELVQGQDEKVAQMVEAFFDPAHADHRHARSIKDIYVQITGDSLVTGRYDRCDAARLTEALGSTSLPALFADAANKRMLSIYQAKGPLDAWRRVAKVVPVGDFKTQHRVAWGGYGDLPDVAENGPYQPLTSPGDEEATYKVSKKGGTESYTLEAIKNDDVQALRDIPNKLARTAKRTLSRRVFNLILANPIIYDGKAFFHVDHGNLGTAALGKSAYFAARTLFLRQAEPGSDEPLYIEPRRLLVPAEREEDAYNMFVRGVENDPDYISTLKPEIVPVWCQTDANDWSMMADPEELPAIEVGFLDGQEEPELFSQDNPAVGTLFTNDAITLKIRHIHGVVVTNWRGARRHVVV